MVYINIEEEIGSVLDVTFFNVKVRRQPRYNLL